MYLMITHLMGLYRVSAPEFDMKDGISLLSVKSHLMLSYLQSLVLLSARRALGHPLSERSPPTDGFSSTSRGVRGAGTGDRVDAMIEDRVVLEKIKVLEGKMRYQIDKLVRVAEESPEAAQNVANGMSTLRVSPFYRLTLYRRPARVQAQPGRAA
jgi:U3 small nucleolar ribonucleoprotein protein LCP5